MPHTDGVTDAEALRAAAEGAAAVIFQQPNFFGCLEDAPGAGRRRERRGRARGRARRPALARRPRGAGQLRLRARDRRGPGRRQPARLRRPALRLPGREGGVHPPDAGPDHRRDDRPRRAPRLRADAADARAAHPPREGDLQHHDEPDAARARRPRLPLLARPEGAARGGGALPCARRAREAAARPAAAPSPRRPSRSSRCISAAPRAAWSRSAAPRACNPGYPLGRDYPGMDDVLLVAVTEKRTLADDRARSSRC